jgi:RNA-directed DNA polymerase
MRNARTSAFSDRNLRVIWQIEKKRLRTSISGVDRQSPAKFEANLSAEFRRLRERAASDPQPQGLLAIAKPKPEGGNRIICVPTISDRFFQAAVLAECRRDLNVRGLLNPISYGLARDSHRTVQDARQRALAMRSAHRWVLKADIQKFFDNVPREAVREAGMRIMRKTSLQSSFFNFVAAEIEDGFDPDWKAIVASSGIVPGKGVRQGMPLSPYYAGIVLLNLDRAIQRRGYNAIRYVDDIVGFFDNKQECESFNQFLQDELGKIGLLIGVLGAENSKTVIYDKDAAASFLGMEIVWRNGLGFQLRISDKTLQKISTKFAQCGHLDGLLQRRITLPRFGKLLDDMERGYVQAYECAKNHSELVREVHKMKDAALQSVMEETFGELLNKLDRKRLNFLGLPPSLIISERRNRH